MLSQGRSRAAWFAAGFSAAAALAAIFGSCRGRGAAPSDAAPATGEIATRATPSHTGHAQPRPSRPRAPRDVPESAAEAVSSNPPGTPAIGADRPRPDAPDDETFPWIEVEVRESDGRPCPAGRVVYALEAGSRWTDGPEPPHTETDDAGRCRLHVLRPGRYDVGVVSYSFHALATDVDIPSAHPVRLVFPECVRVEMPIDQPLFAPGVQWSGTQVDLTSASPDAAAWPGRGEAPKFTIQISMIQASRELISEVARGTRCRVTVHAPDFSATPATVVAPATARIARDRVYGLRPRLTFAPAAPPFGHPAEVRLTVSAGDGHDDARVWIAYVAPDAALDWPQTDVLDLHVRTPSGTLRWSGEGFVPGSAPYEGLVADETRDVPVTVRFARDAPYPTRDADAPDPPVVARTIRVGSRPSTGGVPRTFLCDRDGNWTESDADRPARLEAEGVSFALAISGEFVGGPVDVGLAAEGEVEVDLVRGGRLIVVPESTMPPASLGEATLARRDGLPFFADVDAEPVTYTAFGAGLVLGPLQPGDVEFVVRIGEHEVAVARATVRAGAYEPLRIPKLTPR